MGILSKLFEKIVGNSTAVQQNYGEKDEKQLSLSGVKVKVNIETRENTPEIPPLQGEYAKTIFLYANSKPSSVRSKDDYQRYLIYECGIKNPSEYHQKLIEEGYFELTSTTEFLKGLKVAALKTILSNNNLATVGKKEVLIERIIENVEDNEIKKYYTDVLYSVSNKGKEFLEIHNDYVEVHRHKNWGIDWHEFDANKKEGFSFYDVVWGILNKRVMTSNNFGRNEYLCMYQLLEEEGKRKRAIEMLLRVIYIDFSGIDLLKQLEFYKSGFYTVEKMKEYFDVAIMLAPGLIKAIPEYVDVFEDEMIEKIYEWKLPVQVCEKELFTDIIHSIIEGTYDEEKTLERLKVEYDKTVERLTK